MTLAAYEDPSPNVYTAERPDRAEHGPSGVYIALKRPFEVSVCLLVLPIALVVGLVCALAIAIESRGRVIFTQERTGRFGKRFRMYKFRTMVDNAEVLKPSLADRTLVPAPDFKLRDDPRATRVGRLLRRTSLDELPQLVNVLRGQMSLVGPRPTSFDTDVYEDWHMRRLDVLPGMTGLWQVKGRSRVTFDERVRYDIEYIENLSFILDLKILLRTAGAVLRGDGERVA